MGGSSPTYKLLAQETLKADAALTGAYAGWISDGFDVRDLSFVIIDLDFTFDGASDIRLKPEFSNDGETTWRPIENIGSPSGGLRPSIPDLIQYLAADHPDNVGSLYVNTEAIGFLRLSALATGGSSPMLAALITGGIT